MDSHLWYLNFNMKQLSKVIRYKIEFSWNAKFSTTLLNVGRLYQARYISPTQVYFTTSILLERYRQPYSKIVRSYFSNHSNVKAYIRIFHKTQKNVIISKETKVQEIITIFYMRRTNLENMPSRQCGPKMRAPVGRVMILCLIESFACVEDASRDIKVGQCLPCSLTSIEKKKHFFFMDSHLWYLNVDMKQLAKVIRYKIGFHEMQNFQQLYWM